MDFDPPSEARVIVNGEPVDGVDPLFVGDLDPAQRAEVSIVTDGAIYDGADIGPEA